MPIPIGVAHNDVLYLIDKQAGSDGCSHEDFAIDDLTAILRTLIDERGVCAVHDALRKG